MTVASRYAGSTVRLNRHFGISSGVQIQATVTRDPVSAYGDDLSLTMGTELTFTVNCGFPAPYIGTDSNGQRVLTGMTTIYLDPTDPAITFEVQPGDIVKVQGEQYRIKQVDFQPGHIQIDLLGGAAEGTAGS